MHPSTKAGLAGCRCEAGEYYRRHWTLDCACVCRAGSKGRQPQRHRWSGTAAELLSED
ncbi:hypothetical protein MGG_17526 [Pyricularia oryzae 70-15]|uniref:Uncharacterized protein n=3 Tax=Pyricularia oryzae TaxID=318829 RepID=G4NE89_PYRO7|nr:uncharacterized protein MGG_17526 [Pyricularia oryzae 70-15]EHA49418.1 hypothetical protein MGG_17526 [Pyricularia oryzae 70-15]ELQ42500.1 hypothetical protein OOU_Y34scaffold00206g9 [Pyricularia oryzae Y34]